MRKLFTYIGVSILCLVSSCSKLDRKIDQTLFLAGDNRAELEQVLKYYGDDAQKLEAARFLIANMPGAYGMSRELLDDCRPFYEVYDSLGQAYHYQKTFQWGMQVDSLWKSYRDNHHIRQQVRSDVTEVKAEYLIEEIDLAFRVWKKNVYTQGCSFDVFCEYILPYRRQNGLIIDSARQVMHQRHQDRYFTKPGMNWEQEVDSLLYEYRDLSHSNFWGTQIPIYNAGTLETLRHGLCAQRCWYNSLLLSALGMPVAVDFVPASGNRNNSHTWNVVLIDGKSHAFESFWDNDRWKYKRIYNNKTSDEDFGKFRLPKVYRHTYSNHIEGPLVDKEVNRKDIPKLFCNMKQTDVSDEYFETENVTVELSQTAPDGARYVYLCVFGYQAWHPVQWGEIKERKATFRAMGKDVVYLPVYYKEGQLLPAASPFKLSRDGKVEPLEASEGDGNVTIRAVTGINAYGDSKEFRACMRGTKIVGMRGEVGKECLCTWDENLPVERMHKVVSAHHSYRYLRLLLPSDSIALGELAFYTAQGRIAKVKINTSLQPTGKNESPEMLTDGMDATTFCGKVQGNFVDVDLGKEYRLTEIGMAPYLKSQLGYPDEFELFYWKSGWESLGRKQANESGYLTFENVPQGVLLMMKNCNWTGVTAERIFTYEEGGVRWE